MFSISNLLVRSFAMATAALDDDATAPVAPLCLVTGTGDGLGLAHQREFRHCFLSPPRHLGS